MLAKFLNWTRPQSSLRSAAEESARGDGKEERGERPLSFVFLLPSTPRAPICHARFSRYIRDEWGRVSINSLIRWPRDPKRVVSILDFAAIIPG